MDFRGILSFILNLRMKFSSICIYKPVIFGSSDDCQNRDVN